MGFAANALALGFVFLVEAVLGLSLLWRVGSWSMHPAALLTRAEGLREGSRAKEVAGYRGEHDVHVSFGRKPACLVFGSANCKPCNELLEVAAAIPRRGLRASSSSPTTND